VFSWGLEVKSITFCGRILHKFVKVSYIVYNRFSKKNYLTITF